MFLKEIRNIFCILDTNFVSATNVARAAAISGKQLCPKQCVLVCHRLYDIAVKCQTKVDRVY